LTRRKERGGRRVHHGRMIRWPLALATIVLAATAAWAVDGVPPSDARLDPQRGALLYEQSCGECHTTQPHWREKRVVHDWPELLFQVERWQRVAGRGWTAREIEDVAAYLNGRFYQVPCPRAGCLGKPA